MRDRQLTNASAPADTGESGSHPTPQVQKLDTFSSGVSAEAGRVGVQKLDALAALDPAERQHYLEQMSVAAEPNDDGPACPEPSDIDLDNLDASQPAEPPMPDHENVYGGVAP